MATVFAGAGAGDDARKVVRAVADERRTLLAQRGENDFSHLAVGQHLARLRVDDLHVHEVFPNMHTVVSLAGDADARAVNLGQAIDIEDFDAQLVRDAVAHLLAPALGTDNALLQVELVAQAARGYFLGEQKCVARRAGDDRGMQVLHHLKLLLGVAGTHRDRHGA